MPARPVWTADVWMEREMDKGSSRIIFSRRSHHCSDLGLSSFNFCNVRDTLPWFNSSTTTQQWQPTVDHVCTKASSRSLVLLVPPVQWYLASGRGGRGSTSGQKCDGDHHLSSELWPMKSDSYKQRVYRMDMSLKNVHCMYSISIGCP